MSSSNDEKNILYKYALAWLNKEYREKIEADHPTIDRLNDDVVIDIQKQIADSYKIQDRFKIYHVTKVINPNYAKLEKSITDNRSKFDFLINPNFSDWSIVGKKLGVGHFEFSFSRFNSKLIKNEDEAEAATKPLIAIPYYFQFMAEFKAENDTNVAVLSFPAYRPHPYGTYEFDQEIGYFYDWVRNFGLELAKVDCKDIFDSLDDSRFDKFGFKGEDLQSQNELVKSIFKLKHNKRDEHSKAMHAAIDNLVGPEMIEMISSGLQDALGGHPLPDQIEAKFKSFLESIEFSRKFFSSIQKGCEHGVGYAKYSPNGSPLYEYNLEYTKTGQGLVRCRTEKWSSFEPVYNEIVRYFKRT